MKGTQLIFDGSTLNHQVELYIQDAKNDRKRLHIITCSCLAHYKMHGDKRPADRLISGLKSAGRHLRVNGLTSWIQESSKNENGLLFWNSKANSFEIRAKDKKAHREAIDIPAAIRSPFYDSKAGKQGEGQPFNPDADIKAVKAFIKRHATMAKDNGAEDLASKYESMLKAV